ncbi:phosphatidylglycerol lysyltransferase domain-containing protein, partial [Streptococcus pyogenes]
LKPTAPILERFVHLVYKYGNKFYSFSGLRRYKAKYASKWLPHYISYSPHSWLIYNIIALLIVSKRPVDKEL